MKDYRQEIAARVDQVRTHLGLNKSRFCMQIGLSPQTYNNFFRAQGSKPNVDLLHGICARWGVSGDWLLLGIGTMFRTGDGALAAAVGAARELRPFRSDFAALSDRLTRAAGELMGAAELLRHVRPLDLGESVSTGGLTPIPPHGVTLPGNG